MQVAEVQRPVAKHFEFLKPSPPFLTFGDCFLLFCSRSVPVGVSVALRLF